MEPYILQASELTPKIEFNPNDHIFIIEGSSRPEDVRSFYYPILEWFQLFKNKLDSGKTYKFTEDNPLVFISKLEYFNSSSAKFLFDIFFELKNIKEMKIPVTINWYFDEEDEDMHDAGLEMEELVEMSFNFISQKVD